jgi:DNA polymerase-3 subunit gamma/tau
VRDGLSLLDQAIAYVGTERLTAEVTAEVLGIADRRMLVELAGAVLDRDAAAALRLVARSADRGVDLAELGRSFLGFLRDLEVVARVKGGVELGDLVDATAEEMDEMRGLAGRAVPGLGPVLFDRWARAVDEASRATTPRLLYEMAAVDLCAAEPLVPLGDLLERLEDLELRLRSGAPPVPAPPGGGTARPKSPPAAAPPAAAQRGWGGPPAASPSRPPEPRVATNGAGPSVAPPPPAPAGEAPEPAPSPAEEAARPTDPGEVWRQVLTSLESKRPRLGALLAHASVAAFTAGSVTLAFAEKREVDSAEKDRGQIEAELTAVIGHPTRVAFAVGARPDAAVRSAVARQTDADLADRKVRETEARQHPVIRRAQDVFGAALKEIKT